MGSHILSTRGLTDILLHILGQFDAVLHILVLYELKQDITLRRVRVIAMIGLLVVLLQKDHLVLTLGHLQILQHTIILTRPTTLAQRIGLEAPDGMTFRHGIDMDGDKQVGLVLIGYFCPLVQFHELIGLTGVYDFHIGTVLLYQSSEGQRKLQRQILLLDTGLADSPGIAAAMSGVDHQREILICSHCHGSKTAYRYQK